jgi:hypothetical protein
MIAIVALVLMRAFEDRSRPSDSTDATVSSRSQSPQSRLHEPIASDAQTPSESRPASENEEATPRPSYEPSGTELESRRGLQWLQQIRDPAGGWIDPSTTGIVLLSFLAYGNTDKIGNYRDLIRGVSASFCYDQDSDGSLMGRSGSGVLRDHAIAGLALAECYGATGDASLRQCAEKAVVFALRSRTRGGGWGKTVHDPSVDIETTTWMTMFLVSASTCHLGVTQADFKDGVIAALDKLTNPDTGRVMLPVSPSGSCTEEAATAMGLYVRVLLWPAREVPDSPLIDRAADATLADVPDRDVRDLARIYFGSLAMLRLGRERWLSWEPTLSGMLHVAPNEEAGGGGSWSAPDDPSLRSTVWSTALHLLFRSFYHGLVGHVSRR